jgi:uncharacterized protein YggU (UPF0235/DUF167 family)
MPDDAWRHIWRGAIVIVGVLLSTIGYMVEQRLASIERQLGTLDSRVDDTSAKTQANSDLIQHLARALGGP